MKSEALPKMKKTGTLELSKWQRFWHYSVVLFLLIMPVTMTFIFAKDYFSGSYVQKRYPIELFLFAYVWLIPALSFYFIQRQRLRFRAIYMSVDSDTFDQAVKETAKDLKWRILKKTNTLIVAKSEFSWRSWGELITIIRENDKILFNSICDPDKKPSVASWGMNRLNRKTFEEYLRKTTP